ncbi:MAG: pyruvate kinase [Nanoarchaeota archaeon]|nr:pyruvate kinase [Nanoarchaeota archaeon]
MIQKSTKIIATLGPASDSKETIKKLYKAGMNIARLNFSHGDHNYFRKLIKNIRAVSNEIAILLDTKGPEIRSGEVEGGQIELFDGQKLKLTSKKILGNKEIITINYTKLNKLEIGNTILIDDGLIEAKIIAKEEDYLISKVINGGMLGSKKTVSIRGHNVEIPFFSKKDKEDILFGIENKFDFIAASFVRTPQEVMEIKKFLKKNGGEDIMLISKIEHAESVTNINEIIYESKGIMVARGDLGVEIPLEEVPMIQKKIIKRCNELGIPVIVATQMLESMKENPRPTRAEVGDVATAILDGTDAIMLSGETASGKYPVKAVKAMTTIAKEYDSKVETIISDDFHTEKYLEKNSTSMFVTKAAYLASQILNVSAIITPTESGFTPRKVSRFKPKCPIIAFVSDKRKMRQLQITWGVIALYEETKYNTLDAMVNAVISKSYALNLIKINEKVVITAGHKLSRKGLTNIMEIFKVKCILERMNEKEPSC